jgi:hypothetical protein
VFQDAQSISRRGFISLGLLLLPRYQFNSAQVEFLSFDRLEPLLSGNRFNLPRGLPGTTEEIRSVWPQWIQNHDREIRSRLVRGEEDTLVNFVLFGVSFTSRARVRLEDTDAATASRLIAERVQDFINAVARPESDRLKLLNNLVTRLGYGAATSSERERLRQYVSQHIARYLEEREQYRAAVDRSRTNDAASDNAVSRIYKDRGLSLDTDFRPNYAIEQALAEAHRRGLLKSVRRAAVIGPGLDFTDKDSGFDYYPLQTLQPFALIDSLVRLGMARLPDLKVSVFDISSQTLDHISQSIVRARSRQPYTLQLARDRTPAWSSGALSYWRRLGDRIGSQTTSMPPPPQIRNVDSRAIRIRPEVLTALVPESLNIVCQHIAAPPDQRFDLIVGTNVFIYYDRFEQALALLNMEAMLAPGGVALSNDLVEDYTGLRLRTVATVSAQYTPAQADQVRIYSTPRFQPQIPPA